MEQNQQATGGKAIVAGRGTELDKDITTDGEVLSF